MKLLVFIYLVLVGVGCYFRYFANNPTFHYDGFLGAEIIGWICILGIFFLHDFARKGGQLNESVK